MIDAVATRRFTLGDREYQKDDPVRIPLQQFNDLEPTGLVERMLSEKKAPVKPARKKAAKAEVPVSQPEEPKSSDTAD